MSVPVLCLDVLFSSNAVSILCLKKKKKGKRESSHTIQEMYCTIFDGSVK